MTRTERHARLVAAARAAALAFFFLAGAFAAAAHFSGPAYPEDDAFITYRYAENLAAGNGLVYNPGQRVFGISSPLYALWLTGLKTVLPGAALPDLAVRMNFLFYLATGLGLLFLLRRLLRSLAAGAALAGLFLLRGDLLAASLGGMEPFFFTALIAFALWALFTSRFRAAAALAGVSVLVRPEGILLALVVLVAWLAASRARPAAVLAGLLLPALAWVAFGFAYYGNPVYHSIIAKARPLYPMPAGQAIMLILRSIASWSTGGLIPAAARPLLLVPGLVVFLLVLAGRVLLPRFRPQPRQPAAPDASLLLLLLLFFTLTNPLMFDWYYPPVTLLWFCVFAGGLPALAAWTGRRRLETAALVLLVLLAALPATRLFTRQVREHRPAFELPLDKEGYRLRVMTYRATAEWLNETVPPGTNLAAPEIGALGYYYRRGPVLDACGLVSPEALPYLPVPEDERSAPGTISLGFVRDLRPDVVVTMARYARRSLYPSPWFDSSYVLVAEMTLPRPLWGSPFVDVFFRADLVADE